MCAETWLDFVWLCKLFADLCFGIFFNRRGAFCFMVLSLLHQDTQHVSPTLILWEIPDRWLESTENNKEQIQQGQNTTQ